MITKHSNEGIDKQLLAEVSLYLDEHFHEEFMGLDVVVSASLPDATAVPAPLSTEPAKPSHQSAESDLKYLFAEDAAVFASEAPEGIEEALENLDESFSQRLLRFIDSKGKTDVEVYKAANLDRRLFSKIRKDQGYTPSKRTVLALAVALELSLEEVGSLLQGAGYALSHNQKSDVIIEFFIKNHTYDLFTINEVLYYYDQPLLGA